MSLGQNLFTLHFTQNNDNPNVMDLVDPVGNIHYRKQRVPGKEYKIEVYDWHSESLLITATSLAPATKVKSLELYNPSSTVELKSTGTLSFRWSFKWEEHEFEWKREECYLIRKPDPPVLVAVTKEPAGRLKTTSVQILDYNIHRFDFNDRKGLEIVILTALLTFQDLNESYHTPEGSTSTTPALTRNPSTPSVPSQVVLNPPTLPPKPEPKTGVDRIAELQAVAGEYNEVTVDVEGHPDDYAIYCARLLEDEALLFITIKSASAEQVPKVLQVVEQTKRIRHKAGDDDKLHQYVLYDAVEQNKGPKRINLNDALKGKDKYKPPNSLTIHLSKIDMPELQPKAQERTSPSKAVETSTKDKKASKNPSRSPTSTPTPSKFRKSLTPHLPSGHSRTSSTPHVPPPPPIIAATRPPNTQGPSFPVSYGNKGHHPPQGQMHVPPPSHSIAPSTQKPGSVTSVVTGLFDSLRKR